MAERYDDVRALSELELRALLDRGRPEERVWALWALALKSTTTAPDAKNALGSAALGTEAALPIDVAELVRRPEPDAGVRRNLAVVLAGHGELELLVGLAKRDPAPEVRAAAMQLVARLALDGKLPSALVVERGRCDGPEVRIAILGTVFAGAPAWQRELARALLADRDHDVRYEAFEALVRAGESDVALGWLEEAPEAEARIALMRWTARTPGGPGDRTHTCATQLAGASRRIRRLLVESVRVATWRDLAPSIGDDPSLLRAFVRRDAGALAETPTATLLRAALRERDDPWLMLARDRLAVLGVPDLELAPLLAEYRELCDRRLAELDAQLADLRRSPATIDPRELASAEDYREGFALAAELAAQLTLH